MQNNRSFGWISDRVSAITARASAEVVVGGVHSEPLFAWFARAMLFYQITTGVGVWGNHHPTMWGWDIINFVWWIGIGHAGTLISAILFPHAAEVAHGGEPRGGSDDHLRRDVPGIYPGMHVGRVWFDWWLFPIPTYQGLWPQFRSPLMWDVFAVSTYFTVSVLFWYVGLIPDLATLRDRSKTKIKQFIYGFFALGWTGSNRHWSNYEKAYLILAGLSTPLVLPCTRSSRWTSRCRSCPAGTRPSSRRIRGGRGVLRFRHGADAVDSAAQHVSSQRHHHDAAH